LSTTARKSAPVKDRKNLILETLSGNAASFKDSASVLSFKKEDD
jgi:hypothetical protein